MFENQPKGLWALALANTGERFGYYTMLAVFLLYLQANFGFETGLASTIYSTFLMMVYFLPIIGGIAADKFGFGRMVTTGIFIMFIGYLVLSVPLGKDTVAIAAMGASLILIALGTGLFKGNLQVMVGRLYDEPKYANNRDSGFSLFYIRHQNHGLRKSKYGRVSRRCLPRRIRCSMCFTDCQYRYLLRLQSYLQARSR